MWNVSSISPDSASATFYSIQNVNVSLNKTTTTSTATQPVGITVTSDDGAETVTVPRLEPDVSSGNTSVINTPADTSPETNISGVATTSATAAGEGSTTIEALLNNKLGTASVTVDDPDYGISGVSLTPDTVDSDTVVDHTLQYTVDAASDDGNSDTHTVTLPNSTTITSASINNVTDANGDEISVSSSASLADAGGTNNQLTFGIQPGSGFDTSAVTVDANVTVEFPAVSSDTTADVEIAVSDSNQGDTNATTPVTIRAPSGSVTFNDTTVTNGTETVDVDSAAYTLADGSAGDYVVVAHVVNSTNDVSGPVGYSSNVSGSAQDITVNLNASEAQGDALDTLTENTTLRAMLHETSSSDAFGSALMIDGSKVTDDANITVQEEAAPEPTPEQVEISNVSLTPTAVDANTTNDHTLTFDVSNVSNDGSGDVLTLTFPDGTLVSSGSASAVDSNGDAVGLEPGTIEGDTTNVTFLPTENPNFASSPDLTVTVDNITVSAPDVDNQTTADIQVEWEDSSNGTANVTATLTIEPVDDVQNPEIVEGTPAADTDGDGLLDDFNGNGEVDRGDAQALFNALGTQVVDDNADVFDYNENGQVDRGDVQALFVAAQD
jgi:hypothetical protein